MKVSIFGNPMETGNLLIIPCSIIFTGNSMTFHFSGKLCFEGLACNLTFLQFRAIMCSQTNESGVFGERRYLSSMRPFFVRERMVMETKSVKLHIRLRPIEKETLRELADSAGETMSERVRQLIREFAGGDRSRPPDDGQEAEKK